MTKIMTNSVMMLTPAAAAVPVVPDSMRRIYSANFSAAADSAVLKTFSAAAAVVPIPMPPSRARISVMPWRSILKMPCMVSIKKSMFPAMKTAKSATVQAVPQEQAKRNAPVAAAAVHSIFRRDFSA